MFLRTPQLRMLHHSLFLRNSFKLADIGEGIVQVEVLKWFVKPGDRVQEFDKLLEVQSDKATVDITSRFSGVIKELKVQEGKIAKVGEVLVEFEGPDGSKVEETKKQQIEKPKEIQREIVENETTNLKFLATPAVRHLIKEKGLDIKNIVGSGRDGRILKSDILALVQENPSTSNSNNQQPLPSIKVIPITGIRREMAKTMTAALKIPHLGFMDDVRVDEVYKIVSAKKNITMLSIFIKSASMALQEFPEVNSTVDDNLTELRVNFKHNIGVAMDTPKGLMVPVISDVKSRSIMNIADELNRLRDLGKSGKLGVSDLSGATFTLSNIGSVGGTYAFPIIPPPTVAIGALGRAKRVPIFESSSSMQVTEARIMPISWTADHRVLDGATVARFSNRFKYLIENPTEIMLNLS